MSGVGKGLGRAERTRSFLVSSLRAFGQVEEKMPDTSRSYATQVAAPASVSKRESSSLAFCSVGTPELEPGLTWDLDPEHPEPEQQVSPAAQNDSDEEESDDGGEEEVGGEDSDDSEKDSDVEEEDIEEVSDGTFP